MDQELGSMLARIDLKLGFGNYDGTLVNALAYHFDNLPNKDSENRPCFKIRSIRLCWTS